jgi:glycosyltransferase involved in cell wall biosynthesis
MSNLFFDHRWCAPHGIGRFATEVRKRLTGFADLPLSGSPTSPLDALHLARGLRRAGAEGFFSPGFNVPLRSACPVVVTIHDLIHVHFAAERSPWKTAYYRLLQRPIVRQSPLTLTVSEYSRQQIVQWYDVPEDRVVCVGNGISDEFIPTGSSIDSEQPYFLYVGNVKPHKNVGALLTAFSRLNQTHDIRCKLVSPATRWLDGEIAKRHLQGAIDVVRDIDDKSLAEHYRGAVALVLPSHFEGFGLPLAEAMACGCPVVASNRTSIPEVVGPAGILFDPDDADSLSAAMSDVLGDPGLRERMIAQGLVRAQSFRWDAVAERIRVALAAVFPVT